MDAGYNKGLDRTNDPVYENTTSVVRSVMTLTKEVHSVKSDDYVDLVKVRWERERMSCAVIFMFLNVHYKFVYV